MARQYLAPGFPFPVYVNETARRQAIYPGSYVNETSPNTYAVSASEGGAAADTVTNAVILAAVLAETGGLADVVATASVLAASVQEVGAAAGMLNATLLAVAVIAEAASAADLSSATVTALVHLAKIVVADASAFALSVSDNAQADITVTEQAVNVIETGENY